MRRSWMTALCGALLIAIGMLAGARPAEARWPYTLALGSQPGDRPNAIAFDTAGNSYVAGSFSGSATIGGMVYNAAGQSDIVVVKLNSDGDLLWTRVAGSAGADSVHEVTVDAAGNVYLVGAVCGSLAPAPATCNTSFGQSVSITVPGDAANGYVAKLTGNGTWEWAREVARSGAGATGLRLTGVAADAGGVYVSGWLSGSAGSNTGGGLSLSSRDSRTDALFVKLSAAGQWGQTQTFPTAGTTDYFGKSIIVQGGRVMAVAQTVATSPSTQAAAVAGDPAYALPGGGSCTVSGIPSRDGGATLTCSGVDLANKSAVYLGIKNNATANGNTMNAAVPSGASVFRQAASTATSITYGSTTVVNDVLSGANAIENQLVISRATGFVRTVEVAGAIPNNANGDVVKLLEVGSASFSLNVDLRARRVGSDFGYANPSVFDQFHKGASDRNVSSVDLAFYASDLSLLVALQPSDLAVQGVVPLPFSAEGLAGDGNLGVATIGYVPSGKTLTGGTGSFTGPGLGIARFVIPPVLPPPSPPLFAANALWSLGFTDEGGPLLGRKLAFGSSDRLYTTASYLGLARFMPETALPLDPVLPLTPQNSSKEDILVAGINDVTGEWEWSQAAGGTLLDRPTDLAVDPSSPTNEVAVVGSYVAPAKFGTFPQPCTNTCQVLDQQNMPKTETCSRVDEGKCIGGCNLPLLCLGGVAPPSNTGFAMRAEPEGEWAQPVDRWVAGREVPRPPNVPDNIEPAIVIANEPNAQSYFFWAARDKKLYAVKPTEVVATIKWQKDQNPQQGTVDVSGLVRLPDDPQVHMASAPVDIELSRVNRCAANSPNPFAVCSRSADCGGQTCGPLSTASTWTFGDILYKSADSDATFNAATKVFTATKGWATVWFANGPSANKTLYPVAVVVVRTLDPAKNTSGEPAACTIGTALTDDEHRDPNRKNGWVVNAKSFYDGAGAGAAYVRDPSRAGQILPVNLEDPVSADDDMLVVWYRQDERGIAWPVAPLRYECLWPSDPDTIVIASGLGSDGRCAQVPHGCKNDSECDTGSCLIQPGLDPAVFGSPQIYAQDKPELPGFNPNEEHAKLFASNAGTGFQAVFAFRGDLNAKLGYSEPYVLLKYRDPATQEWRMHVYGVSVTDDVYDASDIAIAGQRLPAPYPLSTLPQCVESCAPLASDCAAVGPTCTAGHCVGGSLEGEACASDANCQSACLGASDPLCTGAGNQALFKDHTAIGADGIWSGWWARSKGTIKARFDYPVQDGFFTDYDGNGSPDVAVGACEPWLLEGETQQLVTYTADWPADARVLHVGETLLKSKRLLPDILPQAAANVVFETRSSAAEPLNEPTKLVRLFDPLTPRAVPLASLPDDVVSVRRGNMSRITGGERGVRKLSPGTSLRVFYDHGASQLLIKGVLDDSGLGEPFVALNVMTERERNELKQLSTNQAWDDAVDGLWALSRNPNAVDADADGMPDQALSVGLMQRGTRVVAEQLLGPKALTAGLAEGTGYAVVAFNNDPTLSPLPISLAVLRVDCGVYQGQVQVIPAANVFDEAITLRHSGDFAGDPSGLNFEWYYALKEKNCRDIPVAQYPEPLDSHWNPLPGGAGAVDVTLSGPGVTSLADTCILARYTGYAICNNATEPSQWAGEPFGPTSSTDPHAQLVPGWLARVTDGLNPFDQRTTDFRNNGVNTLANALVSAGERFEGPIAFNPDADALNDVGLVEIYETVLDRGRDLSIDAAEPISVGAVNSKLLDVAARISDLYMLLGNEALSDALDPTIGFDTSGEFGTAAPSIFAFQDQTDSLLDEELALLRGRDDTAGAPPVYNRLIWNFTGRDGQVAYQQNYKITDQNSDTRIDETDARKLYPQGHGDAWGHYLTAVTDYYKLLRHPDFVWLPRSDSVLVAGSEVLVDFTDERRFAAAAAARARTGAQIVDLTYRQRWVDDPAGQWQGYKDTDADRAFGVSEWAQRAGQGAYFDWVVANAILPPQSDQPPGIQKIDRTTVPELADITGQSQAVQAQLDLVDQGLNPLGLAKNVVPFDIDPSFLEVGSTIQRQHHYEQIADRAKVALGNTVRVFDYANGLTQLLRRNQDTAVDFARNVAEEERDYNNRLIEIFGTPYREDIGPGRTYKTGYAGPDVWNWDVVDESELTGQIPGLLTSGSSSYALTVKSPDWDNCSGNEGTCRYDASGKLKYNSDGSVVSSTSTLNVTLSNRGFGKVKNAAWTTRESPGELQLAQSDLLQARAQFERAYADYKKLLGDIDCVYSTIRGQNKLAADRLVILNRTKDTKLSLNALIFAAKGVELALKRTGMIVRDAAEATATALPTVVGLATDAFSAVRGTAKAIGWQAANGIEAGADIAELAQLGFEQAQEIQAQVDGVQLQGLEDDFEIFNLLGTLGEKLREEPVLRLEALSQAEGMKQAQARVFSTLGSGVRLIDELEAFRKRTGAKVSESRFSDMAFRTFRNDALQKYRAQLDLTSRYVYLAAAAYDYETNQQGGMPQSGRRFLTDIVRQRSLGQFVDGEPLAGSPGLGDTLARMDANFAVLKGQLGFNTPQNETNRFSLRKELFRILDDSDDVWRSTLAAHRVTDLWKIPVFRRFASPPAPESAGALPGIVIPIPTTVTFGLNFFGWPLSGGDSAYDPSNFATKVRTMGVWFGNYNAQGLSNTPRVYLFPAGADVLRSPATGDFRTRTWSILDQRIPEPFPIGQNALDDSTWIPKLDSLSGPFGDIRRHSSFRAYHDDGAIDSGEVTTESRAIARSVWNTRWVLIITGGTLLADPDEGLNTFIYGKPAPGGGEGAVVDPDGVTRDGKGVSDILVFFQTYGLSGN